MGYIIDAGNVFLTGDGVKFAIGPTTKTVTTRIDDLTVQDTVYTFDTTAGEYVQGATTQRSDPLPISDAQNAKIADLKTWETNALATFQSSALGPVHTYLSGQDDMILLNGEFSFLNSSFYDGTSSILWYTVENGNVAHTKAQMCQVYVDGRNHVAATKYKRATKEAQAKATTTIAQINTIGTPTNPNPPSVPTGLTGTAGAAGSGQVTLNWTANSDVTLIGGGGYSVYVDGATAAKNASLVTGTTFTVTGLTTGVHTFAITAVDTDGNESSKCSTVSVTVS